MLDLNEENRFKVFKGHPGRSGCDGYEGEGEVGLIDVGSR